MFGWFKKKPELPPVTDPVANQPPGEIFPWPKGVVLTALDEVVIAIPAAVFDNDRPISEVLFGSDEIGFAMPLGSELCLLKLQPGMSVSLAKSCQAYVVAEDKQPRRIQISGTAVVRDRV